MPPPDPTIALDRLLELTTLLADDMGGDLGARGLTPARAHLVWELHARGPVAQRVLAAAMGVTPRNVTGLVDALVATGFVSREEHPSDRRSTLVTLTDHGVAVVTELEREKRRFADQLFSSMDADQLTALAAGLDAVVATIRHLQAQEPSTEGGAPSGL